MGSSIDSAAALLNSVTGAASDEEKSLRYSLVKQIGGLLQGDATTASGGAQALELLQSVYSTSRVYSNTSEALADVIDSAIAAFQSSKRQVSADAVTPGLALLQQLLTGAKASVGTQNRAINALNSLGQAYHSGKGLNGNPSVVNAGGATLYGTSFTAEYLKNYSPRLSIKGTTGYIQMNSAVGGSAVSTVSGAVLPNAPDGWASSLPSGNAIVSSVMSVGLSGAQLVEVDASQGVVVGVPVPPSVSQSHTNFECRTWNGQTLTTSGVTTASVTTAAGSVGCQVTGNAVVLVTASPRPPEDGGLGTAGIVLIIVGCVVVVVAVVAFIVIRRRRRRRSPERKCSCASYSS